MTYIWLAIAGISFVITTFMGFKEGFETWWFYYVFSLVAVLMFFFKRYMIGRMQKHLQYLEEQKQKES
jgi:cell division protein FtsW (lipid II flippase)